MSYIKGSIREKMFCARGKIPLAAQRFFVGSDICEGRKFSFPGQGDDLVRAGTDTNTTAGTKFRFDIEADRSPFDNAVDFFFRYRVDRIEFERIDRACSNAVAAAGAPVYINMYCKCHDFSSMKDIQLVAVCL